LGADPVLQVDLDVVVDLDDYRHILLSIRTTLSSNERPSASKLALATFKARHASRVAAHSIAEARAIA
jgi:hypothetical protein